MRKTRKYIPLILISVLAITVLTLAGCSCTNKSSDQSSVSKFKSIMEDHNYSIKELTYNPNLPYQDKTLPMPDSFTATSSDYDTFVFYECYSKNEDDLQYAQDTYNSKKSALESLKDKYYPVYEDASTDEYKKEIYSGESTYVILIYQDNKVLEIETLPKHIDEVNNLLEEFGYR